MDDLYAKIQIYLMKKDVECNQLRFLTSRTTIENSEHIRDVCDTIVEIFRAAKIPIEDDASRIDPRCVQAFKYLVLNTCFECQEHLAEDLVNGHLVDMCPALSPYLLMEILFSLKFDDIIAESMLHFPLDLCVEILEISRRCSSLLNFPRALKFVAATTINCYKKMIVVGRIGTQSNKLNESLELLTINWQELIALFSDPKFLRLHEVANLEKSERRGIILMKIIELMRECLITDKENVEISSELSGIYRITFGRLEIKKSNDDFVNHLHMLDQEFAHVLLKKLKEIDCNAYLDWASLESAGNIEISVQQTIGNDCYNLMEIIKENEHILQHDHLIECLQQLSTKPKSETSISDFKLDELRREASNGNKNCIKELLNRYNEWNHETFHVIEKNKNLLDKEDFLNLLEYLTLVMTKSGQEEHKKRVYSTVTRVLMLLDIPDVYETILRYIIKHDARNTLESSKTEETFKNFMAHNKNFKSRQNLRVVLLFLMKNPKKILSIIVKIAIGHSEFTNIMVSPGDLTLLSPIMNIRDNPNDNILLSSLRNILLEDNEFNSKKFTQFIQVMMENCIITIDQIINNVFVPFFNEKKIDPSNLGCALNCLRKFGKESTKGTDVVALIEAIAKTTRHLRNETKLPKYTFNELLNLITRVIQIYLRKFENSFDDEQIQLKIVEIECNLDPIDRHNFGRLLTTNLFPKIDAFDAIMDYERRCFIAMNRIRTEQEIPNDGDDDEERKRDVEDFTCFHDDFIRHLFVKCTEKEFVKFAIEAMTINYTDFHYKDEYEGYEKIVCTTIEACVYCLEFPDENSPDSFACLIKGLARFTRGTASLEQLKYPQKMYESLVSNARKLNKFLCNTIFANNYTKIIVTINNRAGHEPIVESLRVLAEMMEKFGNECMEINHSEVRFENSHSKEALRYKIAHEFVNELISANNDESYRALRRIYKLLSSQVTNE